MSLRPVLHDQQQVGPVLRRGQVSGVAEIVPDVEGHPRSAHSIALLLVFYGDVVGTKTKL